MAPLSTTSGNPIDDRIRKVRHHSPHKPGRKPALSDAFFRFLLSSGESPEKLFSMPANAHVSAYGKLAAYGLAAISSLWSPKWPSS